MYEKILQKLSTQRAAIKAATGKASNVSDRTLQALAKSLEPVITTDEVLTTFDFTESIKSFDGNIGHVTKSQLQKAKDDEKAEADRLAAEEQARKDAEAAGKDDKVDIGAQIASALKTALTPLTQEIQGLKSEKVNTSRTEQINAVLKDAPDYYTAPIIQGFDNMNFETDEDFTEYLSGISTAKTTFVQALKEQGLPTNTPNPRTHIPEETGETDELSDARKILADSKEKAKKE